MADGEQHREEKWLSARCCEPWGSLPAAFGLKQDGFLASLTARLPLLEPSVRARIPVAAVIARCKSEEVMALAVKTREDMDEWVAVMGRLLLLESDDQHIGFGIEGVMEGNVLSTVERLVRLAKGAEKGSGEREKARFALYSDRMCLDGEEMPRKRRREHEDFVLVEGPGREGSPEGGGEGSSRSRSKGPNKDGDNKNAKV